MNILIIYVNTKNKTIFRVLTTFYTQLEVGQVTSMGWRVLDIQYFVDGKFYTFMTYNEKMLNISKKYFSKKAKKEKIKKIVSLLEKMLK